MMCTVAWVMRKSQSAIAITERVLVPQVRDRVR